MRYMIMHKTSAHWEAGAKPTRDVVQRVGALVGELYRAGVMVAGEGLGPSSEGARVRIAAGSRTVMPGPFGGEGALPGHLVTFRAATLERAAEVAARCGRILGDGVVDVRPVNEPWDIGLAPKPEGLTTRRYMAVANASPASEAGVEPSPEQSAALGDLAAELDATGALIGMQRLEPSRKGKRLLRAASGAGSAGRTKRVVVDGPFSETKELIGGFVTVEVASIEDAVRWALRYADVVETEEVDVRGVLDAPAR